MPTKVAPAIRFGHIEGPMVPTWDEHKDLRDELRRQREEIQRLKALIDPTRCEHCWSKACVVAGGPAKCGHRRDQEKGVET